MLPQRLPHLKVVITLRLQPPLYRLHVVFPIRARPRSLERELFGVRLAHLSGDCLLLEQFAEIGYEFLKGDGFYAFGLQGGHAHLPQDCNLDEHPPQNFVHS